MEDGKEVVAQIVDGSRQLAVEIKAQRDLALVAAPKLVAALITWLACGWIVVQRRRQHLRGAAFARASLLAAIPAVVALYLSLHTSR